MPALFALLALAGLSPPDDVPTRPDPQVAAIRSLLDTQAADWNRKELDGFLKGYWNNPGVVFLSGGNRSEGFEAMSARYRARYQGEGKEMGRLAFSNVEVIRVAAQ